MPYAYRLALALQVNRLHSDATDTARRQADG